jgi:hypothetical protein
MRPSRRAGVAGIICLILALAWLPGPFCPQAGVWAATVPFELPQTEEQPKPSKPKAKAPPRKEKSQQPQSNLTEEEDLKEFQRSVQNFKAKSHLPQSKEFRRSVLDFMEKKLNPAPRLGEGGGRM